MVKLSERLRRLADEIQPGDRVADIGTDHGLLPIFLYENKIASHVILCDVNAGPLEKARENIRALGASGLTDLRRGDGLSPLTPGEADVVVIAGMGGLLIADILARGREAAQSCRRLVLQPRNAPEKLRRWLRENGYQILREVLAREGGRICEIITAAPERDGQRDTDSAGGAGEAGQPGRLTGPPGNEADWPLSDEVSPLLFSGRNPLLIPFLEKKLRTERDIVQRIQEGSENQGHQRLFLARERMDALEALLRKAREQQ